jgi:hypothetical protein
MIITNKILPVALIAILIGGSAAALIMHSRDASATTAATTANQTATVKDASTAADESANQLTTSEDMFKTPQEQVAYKTGFADGFRAAEVGASGSGGLGTTRVSRNYYGTRRVYYEYPRHRSFWQKHRDKLTLAMGTGAGAAIGGLLGGKKWAGIGALSGLGGSALYTYKLRHRSRRY